MSTFTEFPTFSVFAIFYTRTKLTSPSSTRVERKTRRAQNKDCPSLPPSIPLRLRPQQLAAATATISAGTVDVGHKLD